MNEDFLIRKLNQRREMFAFRELKSKQGQTDFCSNDYLGIVTNKLISLPENNSLEKFHGSTGSRLISGNYPQIEELENKISDFHQAEAALIFNSGYDANLGLLGCIPQRNDTILYDKLSHASIRDGIRLSHAFAFSFDHNSVDDLERGLQNATGNIFVVTESVFSMDGDQAPLTEIVALCELYNASLIVDEAHATGLIGERGEGLVQQLGLQSKCLARIHTFGKALGCHGAVVLGSSNLRDYLVNFSRPFIYTTAMPVSAVQVASKAYHLFPTMTLEREKMNSHITTFKNALRAFRLCDSVTPIQGIIVPGNEQVKKLAATLQQQSLDVRAILYPTVPKELERLRIVIHSFNTSEEIGLLTSLLSTNIPH